MSVPAWPGDGAWMPPPWGVLESWLLATCVAIGVGLLLLALRRTLRRRHRAMLETSQAERMELPLGVIARTSSVFVVAVSVFFGLRFLALPERVGEVVVAAITVAAFLQLGIWTSAAFQTWLERKRRDSLENDRARLGSINIIGLVVRALIWVLVLLLTLDNFGVNITALVAGLGIGGIAVALALQNILGDLFASLAIALDQPFVVGDFLAIDEVLGSVENIGIKSTRLRSLSGEQVIMSNADLLGSRVRNYGRMRERRADFTLNLTYDTTPALLEAVPGIVRGIVEAQAGTRFDRCHFSALGAHSLDFECVYFVLTDDFGKHMDVRQAINLAVVREFERRGIQFAYPTRTVLLSRATPARPQTGSRTRQAEA